MVFVLYAFDHHRPVVPDVLVIAVSQEPEHICTILQILVIILNLKYYSGTCF